ncbi:MAG TPA: PilZ domain-containing protein [Roseiarcus sp.]|nr:PilZ domain-containing protein [Roseiarcus sp.]
MRADNSSPGDPFQGQRAEPRIPIWTRATVRMPDGESLPVTVVDLSTRGCQIRLDRPLELPRQFDLQIRELTYVCERRWAKDLSVGVQFLDLSSRRRQEERSLKGVEVPKAEIRQAGDNSYRPPVCAVSPLEKDLRAEPRLPVYIAATVLAPLSEPLPVTIVDLADGGCQIRLARPLELPQRFELQFRNLTYVCERRWAKDVSVGVQFIDLCSRVRRNELSAGRQAGDPSVRPHPQGAPGATLGAGVQSIAAGLRKRFRALSDGS